MDNKDLNELRDRLFQILYDHLDYQSSTEEIMRVIEFVEARIEQAPKGLVKVDLEDVAKRVAQLIDKELGKAQERRSRVDGNLEGLTEKMNNLSEWLKQEESEG